jgi:hypothetical protein
MNVDHAKIWTQKQKEREKFLREMEKSQNAKGFFYKHFPLISLALIALSLIAVGVFSYGFYSAKTSLEISGNTIFVRAGGDFQAALNQAKSGDTIQLQAGAAFQGSFVLPKKAGAEFITIRTSAPDAQLPPAGVRIDPAKYAPVLPRLVSPTVEPVIKTAAGAHHFRFIGIEFGATKSGVGNIIQLGTTEEKRIEDLPHHIEFDRVYIHGSPTEGQRRGIAANGKFIRIINSHISDIKKEGDESQAIAIWATDGPVEIINNYLEAAAENILFGGAESFLQLVPADCIVRGNHLNKPLDWRGTNWVVKNLFEIKNGRRIKVENNLMTNNWGMAQDGTAVLFTVREDSGKDAVIEDIEFTNNIVRGSGAALNIYGAEGKGGHRLTIRNNFFEDINGQKWNGSGAFLKSTAWNELVIENNTVIHTGNITTAYETPVRGFVFRNNIVFENEYGFKGDATASGNPTIDKFFPGADITHNAIIGGNPASYRGKNIYPSSVQQIGFMNFEAKDYRLRPDSPLRGRGFGGKQIGADLDSK